MKQIIIPLYLIILLVTGTSDSMTLSKPDSLSECLISTNCVRVEWSFRNINQAYEKLIEISSDLPRVTVIESNRDYWHGIVRSFIFRFPDDLEILRIPSKNIIQVRSASRIGLGDLGVNQKRVNQLYSKLNKSI